MPPKVTVTIVRETESVMGWVSLNTWGVVTHRTRYYLKHTPKRRKMVDDLGKYLWQALGLPDEDGEHQLVVDLDAGRLL
jgi:hypothetical protein